MDKKVLKKYHELITELQQLSEQQEQLPKGSILQKRISGRIYHYHQYREGKTVKSIYIKAADLPAYTEMIEKSKANEAAIRRLTQEKIAYERLLGIHSVYRPVKKVDYQEYTLFISTVIQDYKRLGRDGFIAAYDPTKHRGICKRYLLGFLDYIAGIERPNTRKTNDLVLDPDTYHLYYEEGDKNALEEALKNAIPAFLNQGLLVTSVL